MKILKKDICQHEDGWLPNLPDIEFAIEQRHHRLDLMTWYSDDPVIVWKCKQCGYTQRDGMTIYMDKKQFHKNLFQKYKPDLKDYFVRHTDWGDGGISMKVECPKDKKKHSFEFAMDEVMPIILQTLGEMK